MNVVVTGGSGFIGSHVVDALMDAGHRVTVLDHRVRPHRSDVDFEDVDLLDLSSVLAATREAEHIFHLAAVSNVSQAELTWCTGIRGCMKQLRTTSLGSRSAIRNRHSGNSLTNAGIMKVNDGFLSISRRPSSGVPRHFSEASTYARRREQIRSVDGEARTSRNGDRSGSLRWSGE